MRRKKWVVEEGEIGRRMDPRAPPAAQEAALDKMLSEGSKSQTKSAAEKEEMAMVARALAGA